MLKRYFQFITTHPMKIVFVGILFIIAIGSGATKIVKDTTADAFISPKHPALVNKKKLEEIFGLTDPLVVVIENKKGVFNPQTLSLIYDLSEKIQEMPEVKNDGITSLATQKNIRGVDGGMEVKKFITKDMLSIKEAEKVGKDIDAFPLLQGTLVAKDHKATLIIADLKPKADAELLYKKVQALADTITVKNTTLYVAGEGAVSGYMGAYIDADARKLNPFASIIIMIVLFMAFRRLGAVMLPNLVILGAVATALGSMGHSGISFFVITNAMPVVLIGISVADSIHILSTYYERRRDYPNELPKDAVVESMLEMWRPIGLTTLTTMAGFLGLALSSSMPPMYYFGIFAMIGVAAAWLFSVTLLPALMAKFRLKQSPLFVKKKEKRQYVAEHIATLVSSHPAKILLVTLFVSIIAFFGASRLIINEDRITTFHPDEPIVKADNVVNSRFNGSHYLDILVDTHKEEGLFLPAVMKQIDTFEKFVLTLPHVKGVVAYTDYLKQMNKSLNENRLDAYSLPKSADAAAQYFLLYSASASSDDFENILDYDYQKANIRIYLDSGQYKHEGVVIKAVESYIDTHLMLLGSKTIPKLDLKTGFKVKFNVGNPATSQKG